MNESMKTHGDFGWRDLMTDDVDKARQFYTDVIGWSTEVMDVGKGPYTVFKIGDRPVAGLMDKSPTAPEAPRRGRATLRLTMWTRAPPGPLMRAAW